MAEKVAIVTGSSSGVGKEAARELAGKGFHVVFACRNKAKAEDAIKHTKSSFPSAKTTFLELDTGKMKSVQAFAKSFQSQFDRLDVIAHNAGSGYFLSKDRTTEDGLEAFYHTNFLGPFLLTQLLKDTLKKSGGRVVTVTSIEHWEGSYDFEKVVKKTNKDSYATSKLMMLLFAFELFRREGIPAAAVNPGAVNSGIWWYMRGMKKMLWDIIAALFFLTPSKGCQTLVHAATTAELPPCVYYTPYKQFDACPYYSDMINYYAGPLAGKPDPKAYREEHSKKLWDLAMEHIQPYLEAVARSSGACVVLHSMCMFSLVQYASAELAASA
eukprot:CAMPEP_0197888888 /NCGR_PEP_ID=MMETSP1439-20131203/22445_1 /TAXON_ID=66791 /ORGANISM="Gonyaulax spinifera, Strain CCMP409" /LENGTH=326 /DNA_ID=CAMNT_0043508819 /DNA_START=71 /DNA_END=1046 /DNA_ORIENTATION=+